MAFIGLIPARGGSKGIPGKNIAPCAGKPLIAWTCEAALASRWLDRVVVSTDCEQIAAVARQFGVEVPFLRPAHLAADDTPSLPVMEHALDWAEAAQEKVEGIVLLQPTSPLRRADHIDGAIELFRRAGGETVVSVVEVPHRFHPRSVLRIHDDRLHPYLADGDTVTRRQELSPVFARNGPAVLIVLPRTLRSGRLYGDGAVPYSMKAEESVDIDSPLDMQFAEFLLQATLR